MNKESYSAQFVVAINFDIDSLASTIAEQHDDTIVDLIRLILDTKHSSMLDAKVSEMLATR